MTSPISNKHNYNYSSDHIDGSPSNSQNIHDKNKDLLTTHQSENIENASAASLEAAVVRATKAPLITLNLPQETPITLPGSIRIVLSKPQNALQSSQAFSSASVLPPPLLPIRLSISTLARTTSLISRIQHLSNMTGMLQKIYPMGWDVISSTKRILERQYFLKDNEATFIDVSDSLKKRLLITNNRIHCINRRLDSGAYSNVYSANVIVTETHIINGKAVNQYVEFKAAIKESIRKKSFEQGKLALETATGHWLKGIDYFKATFYDQYSNQYSMHKLFTSALDSIKFAHLKNPITALIKTLILPSKALDCLHKNGYIHRDIKPANILVKFSDEDDSDPKKIKGALTDFDFLCKEHKVETPVVLTYKYMDPSMFGETPEISIWNQCRHKGIQTKQSDIYALGITFTELLTGFITTQALGTQNQATVSTLIEKNINYKTIGCGKFMKDQLIALTKEHGWISQGIEKIHVEGTGSHIQQLIFQYPPIEQIEHHLLAACELIQETITPHEYQMLRKLSELACAMRFFNPDQRPTAEAIHDSLTEILNTPLARKRERVEDLEADLSETSSKK